MDLNILFTSHYEFLEHFYNHLNDSQDFNDKIVVHGLCRYFVIFMNQHSYRYSIVVKATNIIYTCSLSVDAMKFIFERLKIVIDENAAACVAGLFTDTFMFICQEKKYR